MRSIKFDEVNLNNIFFPRSCKRMRNGTKKHEEEEERVVNVRQISCDRNSTMIFPSCSYQLPTGWAYSHNALRYFLFHIETSLPHNTEPIFEYERAVLNGNQFAESGIIIGVVGMIVSRKCICFPSNQADDSLQALQRVYFADWRVNFREWIFTYGECTMRIWFFHTVSN